MIREEIRQIQKEKEGIIESSKNQLEDYEGEIERLGDHVDHLEEENSIIKKGIQIQNSRLIELENENNLLKDQLEAVVGEARRLERENYLLNLHLSGHNVVSHSDYGSSDFNDFDHGGGDGIF